MTDYIEITDPEEILKPGDEHLLISGNWTQVHYLLGRPRKEFVRLESRVRRPIIPTPEPQYRLLGFGETIREGDEWHQPMSPMEFMWKPVTDQTPTTGAIGQPLTDRRIEVRRPVTPTPEPQYRMLEVGETIKAGDEFELGSGEWKPTGCQGEVYNPEPEDDKMFHHRPHRRPITPTPPVVTYGGNLNPTDPKGSIGATKCPLHLLPVSLMEETAWVLKSGATKYGAFNWRTAPVCASTYISAIMRHLNKWREREDLDTESGRSHLAHIAANCAILMDAAAHGTLEDDRA